MKIILGIHSLLCIRHYISSTFHKIKPTIFVNALMTTRHYLDQIRGIMSIENKKFGDMMESRLGLDSHVDMTCVGRDAHTIEPVEGQVCTVKPFHDSYKPQENICICNALFAYDLPNGRTILLRINQCLHFSKTTIHSLLCTNQARHHGIIIEDVPRAVDPTNKSRQALFTPDTNLELPIQMNGPVPFLPVRKPTNYNLEFCEIYDITSPEE